MKTSLIFIALIVLVSGCASFPVQIEVSNNNVSLPTVAPPTTEDLSGDNNGNEPTQTTTTIQLTATTSNSCAVPHGAGNYAGGACNVVSCDSGYFDCDGNGVNGCEATAACATTATLPAGANATSTTTRTSANATATTGATTTTAGATTTTAAATTTTAAATTTTAAPTTTTAAPTTTTTPKPDLTATYTSEVHSGPAPTNVEIFFNINNIGTASSGGNSWTHVEATKTGQTTETCDYAMSSISVGTSNSGNCGFVLSAGTWAITITADNTNLIDEGNEGNNVATTQITLS